MARYTTTVRTDWDPETAFRYLAEFSNVADWDPGIPAARNLTSDPLSEGARFEVELSLLGRRTTMEYRTIEIDAPRRVVLRSETGALVSLDTLTFDPAPGGGTAVTYDADLTLKGPLKLADPALQLAFNRLGDNAAAGLAERLDSEPPAETSAGQPAGTGARSGPAG